MLLFLCTKYRYYDVVVVVVVVVVFVAPCERSRECMFRNNESLIRRMKPYRLRISTRE